ncbi:MAG TPA: MoxR family ATPase [Acidimicrobiales bacterium]|nr:MoxR family ATPase [Acidimicrobiales bacterium]
MPSLSALPPEPESSLDAAGELAGRLAAAVSSVVLGKPEAIRLALVALLSGGHLLIEDAPGVGKTLLAKAIARAVGGTVRRVQATPDLLPGELTGVSVFDSGEWRFRPGPLFANVVLVDELNRATPRTQSALLEAMEERQVSVDGTTHSLPEPFFVVATQNPFEYSGTFPLVESQRDRFALTIEMGYPPRQSERQVLLGSGGVDALDQLEPVADLAQLRAALAAVRRVHCSEAVADYVIDLAEATRGDPEVRIGASPRASLALLHAGQAHALLAARDYVSPDDVKAVALAALAHRVVLHAGGDLRSAASVVESVLTRVPVPRG